MLEFHTTDDQVKDLSVWSADHCTVALVQPNNLKNIKIIQAHFKNHINFQYSESFLLRF